MLCGESIVAIAFLSEFVFGIEQPRTQNQTITNQRVSNQRVTTMALAHPIGADNVIQSPPQCAALLADATAYLAWAAQARPRRSQSYF